MGFVVYDEKSGHMQKYYKLASTAKRICTQHNTERTYDWGLMGGSYRYSPERHGPSAHTETMREY